MVCWANLNIALVSQEDTKYLLETIFEFNWIKTLEFSAKNYYLKAFHCLHLKFMNGYFQAIHSKLLITNVNWA